MVKSKKVANYCLAISIGLALFALSCRAETKKSIPHTLQDEETGIIFLDSASAAKKILIDRQDGFFESLSIADMSIQLRNTNVSNDRGETLKSYKAMLQSEMSTFSEDEISFLKVVFAEAKAAVDKVNPALWVEGMELYKTKLNHYGPSVYYTREKGIVIPENIFIKKSVKDQMPIMLHELFHILSRYNPGFRKEIYDLIGFKEIGKKLILPPSIANTILTNPDGVSRNFGIELVNSKGEKQLAMPLILSTKPRYSENMPSFFAYLKFDLYPIIEIDNKNVTLGLTVDGASALSAEHQGDFFKKIKDNTQYIIHPDEILADNFMMSIIAERDQKFDNFTEEGLPLIQGVLDILRKFES